MTVAFLALTVLIVSCQTVDTSTLARFHSRMDIFGAFLNFHRRFTHLRPSRAISPLELTLMLTSTTLRSRLPGLVGQSWQPPQPLNKSYPVTWRRVKTSRYQLWLFCRRTLRRVCHYVVEASTDKGFGSTAFYATYVRSSPYGELSNAYDELQINNSKLQQDYSQLFGSYESLNLTLQSLTSQYSNLQTAYNSLNFELWVFKRKLQLSEIRLQFAPTNL